MIPKVNQLASERLKDLLEKKHLYQKVSLDLSETIAAIRPRVHPSNANAFNTWLNDLQRQRLILSTGPLRVASRDGAEEEFPTLILQNLKLYTRKCQRREAFVPAWFVDFANEYGKQRGDAKRGFFASCWISTSLVGVPMSKLQRRARRISGSARGGAYMGAHPLKASKCRLTFQRPNTICSGILWWLSTVERCWQHYFIYARSSSNLPAE